MRPAVRGYVQKARRDSSGRLAGAGRGERCSPGRLQGLARNCQGALARAVRANLRSDSTSALQLEQRGWVLLQRASLLAPCGRSCARLSTTIQATVARGVAQHPPPPLVHSHGFCRSKSQRDPQVRVGESTALPVGCNDWRGFAKEHCREPRGQTCAQTRHPIAFRAPAAAEETPLAFPSPRSRRRSSCDLPPIRSFACVARRDLLTAKAC